MDWRRTGDKLSSKPKMALFTETHASLGLDEKMAIFRNQWWLYLIDTQVTQNTDKDTDIYVVVEMVR